MSDEPARTMVGHDGTIMRREVVCERCWAERCGWKPGESTSLREPVRVIDVKIPSVCGLCGFPTWVGIFIALSTGEPAPHDVMAVLEQAKAQKEEK